MTTNTAQIIPFSAKDAIQLVDGKPVTTSTAIAERFEKRHDNVIKAIRQLDCSPEFNALNFEAVEYLDSKGEKRPMYQITRDGFVFLCMGFTGAEAAKWKEAYINAFNEMEKALHNHPDYRPEETRDVHKGGLTKEQIRAVIDHHRALCEMAPKETRGQVATKLWSSVKKKFGVSYKYVPSSDFTAVLSLLSRVAVEGEYLPKPEPVNALHELPKASPTEQIFSDHTEKTRAAFYRWYDGIKAKLPDAGWPDIDVNDLAIALIKEQMQDAKFCFRFDMSGQPEVALIPRNEIMTSADRLPDLIAKGGAQVPKALLPKIIEAVAKRMQC